jgi:hypothetical protein
MDPIVALANDLYSSRFQQELCGRPGLDRKKKSAEPTFENQDFYQVCGDSGLLVCCRKCPISLHLQCAGINNSNELMYCTHHGCSIYGKSAASVGVFFYFLARVVLVHIVKIISPKSHLFWNVSGWKAWIIR